MKKIIILGLTLLILPIFAYEVYNPQEYSYQEKNETILFVIDFSNSMGEYLEHKTKTAQIKEMLKIILPQIPPNKNTGLRVYGHTCNVLAYNACRSSELVVPLAPNNSQNINTAISKLRPRGMTPITYSLKQAIKKDFANIEGNKHIILLTDGGENCDESPCDYAIKLVRDRHDVKIDVIAFDVYKNEDLDQLSCVANVTGGRLVEANTKSSLINSAENLLFPQKFVEAVIWGK